MLAGAASFTSCTGDMEMPPMIAPEATIKPNTTIEALKAEVWKTDRNYVTEIGQRNGKDIIIAGRVVSNDKAGNVFKNVVLQDETAALTVAINAYDLYETYQPGQQVVVNLTGLKIGAYNGLLQLGGEGTYNGAPSMTFMEKDLFAQHAQQNGLADIARIDTIVGTISEINTAKNSVEGLQKWQSQLIRIDGVSFEDAGKPFADGGTTNRYVKDASGNRINVRNSSYADFAADILPTGTGAVVGILSYYGTDWQIILNDIDGLIGFDAIEPGTPDDPTPPAEGDGDGTKEAPYTVAQVLGGATGSSAWITGYIVGTVTDKSIQTDAEFGTANANAANILIAATPDVTDYTQCVPVQLTSGSATRTALNLKDHPENLGKEVKIEGSLEKYFGVPGLKSPTNYEIDGSSAPVTPPGPVEGDGNGSLDAPYSVSQVQAGVSGTGWMFGYIVGTVTDKSITTDAEFGTANANAANLLLAASPDVTDYTQCVPVQLTSGSKTRAALNLKDHPENLGKLVKVEGSFENYFGVPGLKSPTNYELDGQSVPVAPTSTYTAVTSVTSGKSYAIVADGKQATPLSGNYGYLQVVDVTVSGNTVEAADENSFLFTAVTGGYTIKQADGRYLYMTGTYNSFNVSTDLIDGYVWTVAADANGNMVLTNVSTGKTLQYDSQYNSYGAYPDVRGTYPKFYEKK